MLIDIIFMYNIAYQILFYSQISNSRIDKENKCFLPISQVNKILLY